jgi:hypothetical protein
MGKNCRISVIDFFSLFMVAVIIGNAGIERYNGQ